MQGSHSVKAGSIRLATIIALLMALFALLPLGASSVRAVSTNIVISQVYGGGGNASSPLHNDFIELYNLGAGAVTMTNWSVQYQGAAVTTWTVTTLNGTINPGQYFLIQEGAGTGAGSALPTPDATGTTNLSATAGKIALVSNNTALTCSTNATCFPNANIIDLVGYGTSTNAVYEGTGPAPAPSNTTADLRKTNGTTETDDNSADFTTVAPCPRNTTLPASTCTAPVTARIHDIQGATHISPLKNQSVSAVPGIVTAVKSNGFFMQDPTPDSDDATSEGIFVFLGATPTDAVGDSITVNGTVSEFRPGGSSGTNNLTVTELTASASGITLVSSANALPAPIVIGTGGRVAPSPTIEDDASGDVETSGVFDPANDAIDFYESLEGMRVQINNTVAVGPTNAFGETPMLPDNGGGATNRTARGGVYISDYTNANPRRVILNSTILAPPMMNVGDTLTSTTGVMDYDFGNFMVAVTSFTGYASGGLTKEVTAALASADQIAIATFNVENLDPGDGATKFNGLANVIVNNLHSPDIIALEEVQDNNGATDNGVVDAATTANTLITAIQTAGGPTYQYRDINPVNDQDGGEPGGNIRVAFLFRTDRGVAFVDRAGGTSTNPVSIVTDAAGTHLSFSPGRIDPTNTAFNTSRKPLAGEFIFHGQRLFLIANHFNSKGGDTPLFGHVQPPTRSSETQRSQQAMIVHDFVQNLLTTDPQANVVVLGDLNDFQFSNTLATLKGTILTDLITTLPANEQYAYDFEGNSQVLDHILVSNTLNQPSLQYDVVHVNSEFADQVSDHEPQVLRLTIPVPAPTVASVSPASGATAGGNTVSITGTNFRAGATVTFGGTVATNVVVVSGTTITATAPAHDAGTVEVRVTNTDMQFGFASAAYFYGTTSTLPPAPPAGSNTGSPPNPAPDQRPSAPSVGSPPNPIPPSRP